MFLPNRAKWGLPLFLLLGQNDQQHLVLPGAGPVACFILLVLYGKTLEELTVGS